MCVKKRDGHGWGKTEDYAFVTVSWACLLHVSTVLPSPLSPLQSFSESVYKKKKTPIPSAKIPETCLTSLKGMHTYGMHRLWIASIVKTCPTHTHTHAHNHLSKEQKYLLTWICDHTMIKCLCVGVSITNNRFPSMCPTRNITELYTTTFVGHWY